MEDRAEIRAVKCAKHYYERAGWTVTNVAHVRGSPSGYDLLLKKRAETRTVKVKGSEKPYHGIPDLYETQVGMDRKIVADELCVVYLPPAMPRKIAIIPREELDPSQITPKAGYRISGSFKSERNLRQFLVDVDQLCPRDDPHDPEP